MANKIIPYRSDLKFLARELRKNSTLAEVILWQSIKKRALGVQFHRQVPMVNYIVDFYCHETSKFDFKYSEKILSGCTMCPLKNNKYEHIKLVL